MKGTVGNEFKELVRALERQDGAAARQAKRRSRVEAKTPRKAARPAVRKDAPHGE